MGTNWLEGPDGLREYPPYRQTAIRATREYFAPLMMVRRAWASFWRMVTGHGRV